MKGDRAEQNQSSPWGDLGLPRLKFRLGCVVRNKGALGVTPVDWMMFLRSNMSDGLLFWLEGVWSFVGTVCQPEMPAWLCVRGVVSPEVLVFNPSCSHVDFGWIVRLIVLVAEVVLANKLTRLGVVHVCNLTARTHKSGTPDVLECSVKRDRHCCSGI